MDLNALLAGLLTALKHLDETTAERDEARAQIRGELAAVKKELAELKDAQTPKRARARS